MCRRTARCKLSESYAYHADNVARTPELVSAGDCAAHSLWREDFSGGIYSCGGANWMRNGDALATFLPTWICWSRLRCRSRRRRLPILKKDPEALRPAELVLLRNTRPFNVWGLPAISVPCGFTKSGLPIGLQIAGPHWREDLVLRLAHAYEAVTLWKERRP